MRFNEIWDKMVKNGKKARRKGWDVYWIYDQNTNSIETYFMGVCVTKKTKNDDIIHFMDNLLADDWELLNEPRTITVDIPSMYVDIFDEDLIHVLENAEYKNYGEVVTLRNCDILYIKGLIYLLKNYKVISYKEEEKNG